MAQDTKRLWGPGIAHTPAPARLHPHEPMADYHVKAALQHCLRDAFNSFEIDKRPAGVNDSYIRAFGLITSRQLFCNSADVEQFCISLERCDGKIMPGFSAKTGLYLSALINLGSEKEYRLRTTNIKPPDLLGYHNIKRIIVDGDAGTFCGEEMEGGSISVEGNVDFGCGKAMRNGLITVNGDAGCGLGLDMIGGSILIDGDADCECGWFMKGGRISIAGNAASYCGEGMLGGEIHVMGEIASISGSIKSGRIYQGETLVVGL